MDIETRRKISRAMKGKSNFEGKRHTHATKIQIGISQEGHRNAKDHKWVTDKETGQEHRVKGNKPKGTRWGRTGAFSRWIHAKENFQDGRNPEDKGDMARHGLKNKTMAQLKKVRSSDTATPRQKQLAHWYINMHKEEAILEAKATMCDRCNTKHISPKFGGSCPALNEDLRQWFKQKWVRMDTKGNIKGDCAREDGEGKPKCLPLAQARSMDKKDRATAVRRKRREDPNPNRQGAPINVRTENCVPEETEQLTEKSTPTNPGLWSRAKALARSKFDVYPSAYANGWAAKWYKGKGGGWKSANEEYKDDSAHRLQGTTSLAKIYKKDTPGQSPKPLKEQINSSYNWKNAEPVKYAKHLEKFFGKPQELTDNRAVWYDVDGFKRIEVLDEYIMHASPAPHYDFVYCYIDLKVPSSLASKLAESSESITVDFLKNEVGARCASLAANAVTLNYVLDVTENRIKPSKQVYEKRIMDMKSMFASGKRFELDWWPDITKDTDPKNPYYKMNESCNHNTSLVARIQKILN